MRNRLIHPDETWKDYVLDTIQLLALVSVIAIVLYSVDMILDSLR